MVGTDGKCLWRAVWWGFFSEVGPRKRLSQTGEALKDLLRYLESREAGLEHCLRSLAMTVSRVCDWVSLEGTGSQVGDGVHVSGSSHEGPDEGSGCNKCQGTNEARV